MILRRLAQSLRRQDWFTVLLEILIVVVGVFLGIQAANWNETRLERASERQYLVQLFEDMERSADQITGGNTRMARQAEVYQTLLDGLQACSIVPTDHTEAALALSELGRYEFVRLDRNLIDELKSSGRISVIRDAAIRSSISSLVLAADTQERVEPQWITQVSPEFIYARRHYYFDIAANTDDFYAARRAWGNLRIDISAVCTDNTFIAAVANTREHTLSLIRWNTRILNQVQDLRLALRNEIETRGWRIGK